MKQIIKLVAALLLTVFIGIPSIAAVFYYTKPMEDASYNFSILPEDGQEWQGSNGWSVYTNEGGSVRQLTPNGSGGYTGLDSPGQTFYYSRELTQRLDSPMLQIDAVNRSVAVFLDDTLIYSDFSEQTAEIGALKLPMLDYDRTEPVTVSLPPDYTGHILTIAQSSPEVSEKQGDNATVFPCNVTLYCGYAYESSLIASSAQTMLPAAVLLTAELFILLIFLFNVFKGRFLLKLPVFALAILFQTGSILCRADFFSRYWGESPPLDLSSLLFYCSIGTLLLFLSLYAPRGRIFFLLLSAAEYGCTIFSIAVQRGLLSYGDTYIFFVNLPQIIGFLALVFTVICAFFLGNRKNVFFRHWKRAALAVIAVYLLFCAASPWISPGYIGNIFSILSAEIALALPKLSLNLIWKLCLIATLIAVIIDLLLKEVALHTENNVLAQKEQLAVESYENMRSQYEETQMIIHDCTKHYSLLRTMLDQAPERAAPYLDELIGQIQHVRPVVLCQNQILNILINGKLNSAAGKGIFTEVTRSDAPKTLPLTDTQICGLFTNILDNAITAAELSGARPWIRLDFHRKNQHFVFSCENSQNPGQAMPKSSPPAIFPSHGYGIKIIRQIMSQFGENMLSIESGEKSYKITVIIPLNAEETALK